jgi:hypothetical protein
MKHIAEEVIQNPSRAAIGSNRKMRIETSLGWNIVQDLHTLVTLNERL